MRWLLRRLRRRASLPAAQVILRDPAGDIYLAVRGTPRYERLVDAGAVEEGETWTERP